MLIQTKIQIEPEHYDFIKKVYKELNYKSLSEYMRQAVKAQVREDRKRLRALKRQQAMEMIGQGPYTNQFEDIENPPSTVISSGP